MPTTYTAITWRSGNVDEESGIHHSLPGEVRHGFATAEEAWQTVYALMGNDRQLISGTVEKRQGEAA